ncbi:MAG: hypothetical protein HRU09_12785 [Oligoflexales bacterium]|nr:hypothetical protein [Oligoflexales bacterium]
MQCFIKQLKRNFSDNLIGLKLKDGKAELWSRAFSCCYQKDLKSLTSNCGISLCDASKRLSRVNSLLQQFGKTWEQKFTFYEERNSVYVSSFVDQLIKSEGTMSKGFAFNSNAGLHKPSPSIWIMAIAAIWRFGIEAHVVTLGKASSEQILPRVPDHQIVMLVEQNDPLRFPHVAFDFSTIVNWCEGAMIPMWIDVLQEGERFPANGSSSGFNTKQAFTQRIARYKSSPPLSWIEPDCQSRLKSVCNDFERFC